MRNYILTGVAIVFVIFLLWQCNTRWKRMATNVANKECDCFSKMNVSLSKPVANVLDSIEYAFEHRGLFIGPTYGHLDAYDQLSLAEKKELKDFVLDAFDATTPLGACLEKAHSQKKGLRNLQLGKEYEEETKLFDEKTACKLFYYYENYVMDGAKDLSLRDSTLDH